MVKFAANEMNMQELQDGLKKGQIGIAEFVKFAEQNYKDYSEFADQLAAPEYAARRAEMLLSKWQFRLASHLLIRRNSKLFADAMTAINNFMVENKEAIDTFVRDLQIVTMASSDTLPRLLRLSQVAEFLGPASTDCKFLGLRGKFKTGSNNQ